MSTLANMRATSQSQAKHKLEKYLKKANIKIARR